MKFYQTVTTCNDGSDEWVYYEGYNLADALARRDYEKRCCKDKNYSTEVREYDLPEGKKYEDLDENEKCDVLFAYNIIEG